MRVTTTVNGTVQEVDDVWPGESLLYVLRERMGLPGSKNACEQGECGSCTVYLDGEPVCACLVAAGQAIGREVTTVEGLADGESLHPVQQAFVERRRRPVRLLHAGSGRRRARPARRGCRSPSDLEIREALSGNLCRCTGYEKILDAVRLAAAAAGAGMSDRRRRPRDDAPSRRADRPAGSGDSPLRPDGTLKVTGEFAYASDLWHDDMVWGVTLRSPHPHARIRRIDITEALTVPGVYAVLTADDVPGENAFGLEHADQPVLAAEFVRYEGEPVALVAADHPETARRAAAADRRRLRGAARGHRSAPGDGPRRPGGAPAGQPGPAPEAPPRRGRTRRRRWSSRSTTRSACRTRRSSGPSPGSPCRPRTAASTSTSPPSGCTSTSARSAWPSACRPRRCG